MRRTTVKGIIALLTGGLLLTGAVGCGKKPGYERYFPAAPAARTALAAALVAWQTAQPREQVLAASRLEFVDYQHRAGQHLKGYEILGEIPGEGPRFFAVRLTLDGRPQAQKARYCVVGNDPLWVIRQEDLEMIGHWECFEPDAKEAAEPGIIGQ